MPYFPLTRPFALLVIAMYVSLLTGQFAAAQEVPTDDEVQVIKALLIEGQNNHKNWPQTSLMMKSYLEQTDLFSVDVVRTRAKGTDPNFSPDFSEYDVVVSNYNGADWPEERRRMPLSNTCAAAVGWLLCMRPTTRLATGVSLMR